MTTPRRSVLALALAALAAAASGCSDGLDPSIGIELTPGTWGGENAGIIVADSVAHVHVGCTYGNFPLPVAFDRNGRFESTGEYLLRAYPVAVGPTMPARLEGTRRSDELTFTVIVNDTVARQTVVVGPATVTLGREPKLGPCPICRSVPVLGPAAEAAEEKSAPRVSNPTQVVVAGIWRM